VDRPEAEDEVGGVDADHGPLREQFGENAERDSV
jgi:hypothetical protein